MTDLEGLALDRSEPGTTDPVYEGAQKDANEGWRRNTPPIVAELEEEEEE